MVATATELRDLNGGYRPPSLLERLFGRDGEERVDEGIPDTGRAGEPEIIRITRSGSCRWRNQELTLLWRSERVSLPCWPWRRADR